MKETVVLNKKELCLVIDNLTMLNHVDGGFQGDGMTKLYEDLNYAYDRMNDPIYKRLDESAKVLLQNTVLGYKNYEEAFVAAKEYLVEDVKNLY